VADVFLTVVGQQETVGKKDILRELAMCYVDGHSVNGCMFLGVNCNFGFAHFGTFMDQQNSNAAFLGVFA